MNKIRLLLVDDHAILRAGLRKLLTMESDMDVVGDAGEGETACRLARELVPDVAIVDLSMPGVGGIETTRRIVQSKLPTRVVVLTMYDNPHYLVEAIQSGASGYVPKRAADSDLIAAIRAVARGESFLYPSAARSLISEFVQRGKDRQDSYESLTAREKEVLRLIAEGYNNRQIAALLVLSPNTVEVHRSRIREKLNLHDRTEILRYAMSRGLVQSSNAE